MGTYAEGTVAACRMAASRADAVATDANVNNLRVRGEDGRVDASFACDFDLLNTTVDGV